MTRKQHSARVRARAIVRRAEARRRADEHAVVAAPAPAPAAVHLSPYDQMRISKWIYDRMVGAREGCWHCRRPFVLGSALICVAAEDGPA